MTFIVRSRHAIVGGFLRATVATLRRMPMWALQRAGVLAGCAAWALSPQLRRQGDANLQRVFPTWSAGDRSRTLRRCACWLGEAAVEALAVAFGRMEVTAVVRISPHAAEALAPSPKGIVVATGHLGNWELLGSALATMGHATHAVVRRSSNTQLASLVTNLRSRLGWREIPKQPLGALHTLRALRSGGLVGLLCDQHSDHATVHGEFLGIAAASPRGPALLARRSGARMVVAWLEREAPFKYALEAVVVEASQDDTLTMARINAVLGDVIRRHPEQWVWFHDRWPQRAVVPVAPGGGLSAVASDAQPEST